MGLGFQALPHDNVKKSNVVSLTSENVFADRTVDGRRVAGSFEPQTCDSSQ